MENYNEIKKQKLNLKYEGDAFLVFIDDNQTDHKYDFSKEDVYIDLRVLVDSCFEPIDTDDFDGILTCSCGASGCAGFYRFSSKIIGNKIIWNVNHGDLFRFDKDQYVEEIKKSFDLLITECKKKKKLVYFAGQFIGVKFLEELYAPLKNQKTLNE